MRVLYSCSTIWQTASNSIYKEFLQLQSATDDQIPRFRG